MKNIEIHSLFKKFDQLRILIIGDVMIDTYFWGKVDRISPEAPVPIIARTKVENRLGGAANVALNIGSLGATPVLCSVVGNDDKSDVLIGLMRSASMDTMGIIKRDSRMTTVKTRVISDNHHLLRIDEEVTANIDAETEQFFINKIEGIVSENQIDAIIFQDYDKGVITMNLIQAIVELAKSKNIPTLVDPKKRNFLNFKGVTVFKPNFKELIEGLKLDIRKGDFDALQSAVNHLHIENDIQVVMTTLSELGVFISEKGLSKLIPAEIRDIADVSGAGDTVISTASLCLAAGLKPDQMAWISNIAGGLVCERVGVVPIERSILIDECLRLQKE